MKKHLLEISCDNCGTCEYFSKGTPVSLIREYGWIVTRDEKHYCTKQCVSIHKILTEQV
jgi:hypothetical protein